MTLTPKFFNVCCNFSAVSCRCSLVSPVWLMSLTASKSTGGKIYSFFIFTGACASCIWTSATEEAACAADCFGCLTCLVAACSIAETGATADTRFGMTAAARSCWSISSSAETAGAIGKGSSSSVSSISDSVNPASDQSAAPPFSDRCDVPAACVAAASFFASAGLITPEDILISVSFTAPASVFISVLFAVSASAFVLEWFAISADILISASLAVPASIPASASLISPAGMLISAEDTAAVRFPVSFKAAAPFSIILSGYASAATGFVSGIHVSPACVSGSASVCCICSSKGSISASGNSSEKISLDLASISSAGSGSDSVCMFGALSVSAALSAAFGCSVTFRFLIGMILSGDSGSGSVFAGGNGMTCAYPIPAAASVCCTCGFSCDTGSFLYLLCVSVWFGRGWFII